MSQDDIVFDDVKYREPERRCRPDRDRHWAVMAYETPSPIDLPIFLERRPTDAIERHALRDTTVELGGILLGKECIDEETGIPFVLVTESLEAKHYENTQASFTYTHDSWEEITRERDRLHPDLDIVGWYHTHPDFGVFLSSHDLFIHRHFFAQPLQVAYVVDPIRQTRGFFQWRDGDLQQVQGYYLFADRGERIALTRLLNDLENIPNADGGGWGLSPRLEAELIAMLTRPATPYASPTDRTQTAILFSLIGALAGTLALAAVLWLNTLTNQVRNQSDTLKELKETVHNNSTRQSIALDTLLKEANGVSADEFVSTYDRISRERDDLRLQLDRMNTDKNALNDRTRALEKQNHKLQDQYDDAKKDADAYASMKKKHPDIESRIAKLESDVDAKADRVRQLEEVVDTTDGKKAAELIQKYTRTWYAMIAGWGMGILLALGLLAVIAQPKSESESEPGTLREEPPTHHIT